MKNHRIIKYAPNHLRKIQRERAVASDFIYKLLGTVYVCTPVVHTHTFYCYQKIKQGARTMIIILYNE